ncbi:peptidoglycan DD-metalloendopeptidase family protein [Mariniflexile litorale]|uniref:Peptidoglycan DD-metalloendopeptidase family protein n=1 Tax=Mariniflexile litorale TaxID=3045158 RepID=A0AAU7EJK4_9FLAO|nr:peptidoglycan DD-metalloendopeptidase family protein [Mariniflexile sp. KMM 9835]MDQ8211091.1 peptidoglycan DD-metalloendopeptidase family protein [Mariniflexile sp. KMM 9835]
MDKARNRRMGSKYLVIILALLSVIACKEKEQPVEEEVVAIEKPADIYEFGFNLNDFVVKRDTVRKGDSFGVILERNKIGYPRIFSIAEKARDTFDIRRLQIGKPYTLLCSKDSLETPKCFIYQPNQEEFVVISFQDSIHAYTSRKPIKYVEKTVTGVVTSSISEILDKKGISPILTNMLAEQIYAWTIDFTRLQKGDSFKVIYTDKYIDDTIYAGVHKVKAAFFNHKNTPYYAFRYRTDSIKNIYEYYNEAAKDLRRAFLKAPVQFSRISSRYNLNRRIAYYGFALRPHKGTDFAAAIGTPILATANGTVTESQYKGGNGNYVKIRHNSTYETQYLHMQKRKVKVGQHVKQGDVIGTIGMTGNTGGPHVCYRFWKNGKQVDPLREKLSQSEPIAESLKGDYLEFIKPIKYKLDVLPIFDDSKEKEVKDIVTQKK